MHRVRNTTRTAQQRGGHRTFRRFFALLLLVPTVAVQAATTTAAGAAVVGNFEIEGNTADDAALVGIDWDTPGVPPKTSDPVGNADTTNFGEGAKEFEHPSTWVRKTGVAPNQDDISGVYFHDAVVDGDIWGYVGFTRYTTSGTTNFDVEFNRLPNSATNTFAPVRSVGDVLVRFEQDGNSTFKLTSAWFWTRVASTDWGTGCTEVTGYTPRAGWCAESIANVPFTGATGDSGHFAEGAFNFSSLLEAGGIGEATCEGGDFGTMNIRSFTGNSVESALKDYVNPVTIDIDDSCGELEISKVDQFGNPLTGATFEISPNPIPGQSTSPLVVVEGAASDPDGEADGVVAIDPASPGTYTVVETAAPPGGYELVQPVAARTWTVTVGEGGVGSTNTPLTVTNRRWFQAPTILNVPTYDVDREWLVSKAVVGAATKQVPEGTKASFDYEVRLKALDPKAADYSDFGGTITLGNPNTLDMVVTLSAGITGGAACTIDDAATIDVSDAAGTQVDLEPGSNVFTYSCPAATLPGGTTATATWNQALYPQAPGETGPPVTDAKAFAVDVESDTQTTVTDVFNDEAAGTKTWGPFTWSTVRASSSPAAHTITVASYSRTDVPGVAGACTDYDNTARESADGTSATQTVTVCVGKDLDVTKDANLGYQRELLWDIAKRGPGAVFTGQDGDGKLQRSVRYTIDITADGMTDSAWALTGTIMLDNPNEWDVTGTISDTVVVDGKTLTCDVLTPDVGGAAGHQVTVPATSVDHPLAYECKGVTQGAYVGNNTVTFDYSADSHEYPDADDTDSDTQAVTVTGDPDPTNATVTISDLLAGKDVTGDLPQTSFDWATVHAMTGDATADPPLPAHTQRIAYDVVLGTTADACTPYKNVVTIDQTKDSAEATATICSPGLTKSVVADYGRRQPWSLTKDVDKTFVEVGPEGEATFNYTVTATPGQVVPDGTSSWSGVVSVHNPSTTESLTVSVTDTPDVPGWTGCSFTSVATGLELEPGATKDLSYSCTGTGFASGTNTATATFGDQQVDKTVDVAFTPRPVVTDSTTTLTDDIPDDGVPAKSFAVDAARGANVFTYSRALGAPAGACESYTNTAVLAVTGDDLTASRAVRVCEEAPITVDVDGWGSYGVTYPWTIDKVLQDPHSVEVDAATGKASFDYEVVVEAGAKRPAGWSLDGTVEVTNPNTYAEGAITLTDVDVWTDVEGGADCDPVLPDSLTIAPGDTLTVPFECDFTGQPDTSGTVTADVSWDPAGASASASVRDVDDVDLVVGKEVDKTIKVYDDKTDPDNPVLLDTLTWSEGLSKTYSYTLTHEGVPGQCVDFTNTAWLDLSGEDADDSTTATVCVEKPLVPEVSGSADLARAYAWSIGKVADATQRTVDGSGNATFTYTVTARAGAATDSGWQLEGSVTVTNTNEYADGDITADVTAATTLGGGSVCTVTGGGDVAISEDSSVTLPIACTFSSQPASSGALDVTATWDPAGEATTASATDTTPIAFTVRSETNKTVQVVDDQTVAGQRVVLDPALTWTPGLVKDYTYSLTLKGGAAGSCQSWTNTATIDLPVGTDPTASAVVLACTPAPEVLPVQSFGKAVGSVKASCQGTVRAKLSNRSGETVTYKLRVGKKVHKIAVKSLAKKKYVTRGKALAKVTLKVGSTRLDKLRIPALCEAPEVLPDTGLRGTSS
ncbi:SpaA isopeptide-forming pilin-related protein [Nocardia sp. N13]|uniref:SpaA isopeptide-forming pilin-related protein n=1 Tax=Nocardioides sp. N13(2025) TaxID=3453405 RepID=UPI003F75BFA2